MFVHALDNCGGKVRAVVLFEQNSINMALYLSFASVNGLRDEVTNFIGVQFARIQISTLGAIHNVKNEG